LVTQECIMELLMISHALRIFQKGLKLFSKSRVYSAALVAHVLNQ
jgi:hypothetical protein